MNQHGFPSKKDELWKYTSLASITQQDYHLRPTSDSSVELKDIKKYSLNDIDSFKLVFIDGIFNPFLSILMMEWTFVFYLQPSLNQNIKKLSKNILIRLFLIMIAYLLFYSYDIRRSIYINSQEYMNLKTQYKFYISQLLIKNQYGCNLKFNYCREQIQMFKLLKDHQSLNDHKVVTNRCN